MRQEDFYKFDEDPHVHRGGWGGAGEGKALQASRIAEHLGGGQSGAGDLGSARTAAGGADPGRKRHSSGAIRDDGGDAQIPPGLCLVSAGKALRGHCASRTRRECPSASWR